MHSRVLHVYLAVSAKGEGGLFAWSVLLVSLVQMLRRQIVKSVRGASFKVLVRRFDVPRAR